MHRFAVIPRASGFRSELPPGVDVAITRALAKAAAERFTTLTAFVDTLAGHPARVRVLTDPGRMRVFSDVDEPTPAPAAEESRPAPPALLVLAIACIIALGVVITLMLR